MVFYTTSPQTAYEWILNIVRITCFFFFWGGGKIFILSIKHEHLPLLLIFTNQWRPLVVSHLWINLENLWLKRIGIIFQYQQPSFKPSKWKKHQLDECSRMQPFWFWLLKPSSLSCRKSVVKPYQPCPPQLRRSWQPLDACFFSSNSEVSANNWTAIRYLNVYQTNVPAPFLKTKRKSFTTFFFCYFTGPMYIYIYGWNVPAIYMPLFCAKLYRNVQSNAKDRRCGCFALKHAVGWILATFIWVNARCPLPLRLWVPAVSDQRLGYTARWFPFLTLHLYSYTVVT